VRARYNYLARNIKGCGRKLARVGILLVLGLCELRGDGLAVLLRLKRDGLRPGRDDNRPETGAE
jgi:hypothetical protein